MKVDAPQYRRKTLTRFGGLLGGVATCLIGALAVLVGIVDPMQSASPDLGRLFRAEAASGSSVSRDLIIAGIWILLSIAVTWGVVLLEGVLSSSLTRRAKTYLRCATAAALLGGLAASSVVPGFFIGLSLIIDAENGGFYRPSPGPTVLLSIQILGTIAFILALLSFGLFAIQHALHAVRFRIQGRP